MLYLLLLLPLAWGIPMLSPWNGQDHDAQLTSRPAQINSINSMIQHVFRTPDRILSSPVEVPSHPPHGAFINTGTERTDYMRALRKAQQPTTLLNRYEHELLALGLLLLVPVTIGIVELAESIGRHYADEAYPERGRDRQRWEGRERRQHMQMRSEREKMVSDERRWWKRCRRDAL
ncbi:hypothetical protein BJX96DRAFT_176099 [Aspergillus floccosus]